MTRTTRLATLILLLAPGTCLADEQDRLVQLDGSVKTGRIVAMRGDAEPGARVQLAGAPEQTLDLFSLRRIERSVTRLDRPQAVEVQMAHGGKIFARQVTLADGRFRIHWSADAAAPLEVPIDLVRAVRLAGPDPAKTAKLTGYDNFARARDDDGSREDRLFVIASDAIQSVPGVLERINETSVVFRWEDRDRTVEREKVLGVVLAAPASPSDHIGLCLAQLADGSSIWGRLVRLEGGKLVLALGQDAEAVLPWNAVSRLDVRSDRLVFCSELAPVRVAQQSTLTGQWPWRRDRSVLNNPLCLAGVNYERGLGVHADCTLEFNADARFDLLAATIGIDAETKGKGDCLFRVLGDGNELFQKRLRGTDKPVTLRVNITSVKIVSLIVEEGDDWDLADHADWCDARLVRQQADARRGTDR